MEKKFLFHRPPFLNALSAWEKRIPRNLNGHTSGRKYASFKSTEQLPFRVKKHQSVLFPNPVHNEMFLLNNKIQNLKLVIKELNGMVIRPGETFSLCRFTSRSGKRRLLKEGVGACLGEVCHGTDDGMCEISNLINWLLMHSPLKIIKRHQHNFNPFPGDNIEPPFCIEAAVSYNFRDYQFENTTDFTFQLKLWISGKRLEGELRADRQLSEAYHVFEKNHCFQKIGRNFYRKNEVWRKKYLSFKNGEPVNAELLMENFTQVGNVPRHFQIMNEYHGNKL